MKKILYIQQCHQVLLAHLQHCPPQPDAGRDIEEVATSVDPEEDQFEGFFLHRAAMFIKKKKRRI